jgi:tetratricopeptide (TPR) repeat protein
MAPKISLCMIVKNEIDCIEQTIDSVSAFVDEIAIVDTGSTDGTWELIQTLAHRHIQIEWPDHFAEARNQALKLATGDWVLILDGDEILSDGHQALRDAADRADLLGAELKICNDMGDGTSGEFWACRFFRLREDIQWEGRIHEQVLTSIQQVMKREAGWAVERIDVTIEHRGYRPEVFEKKGKAERNVRLLEAALGELPDDAPLTKRVYTQYKLSTALGMGPIGVRYLLGAAQMLLDTTHEERATSPLAAEILVSASQAWTRTGEWPTALVAAEAAQRFSPNHPMVELVLAQAYLVGGNCEAAAKAAKQSRQSTGSSSGFYFDRVGHDVALTVAEATIDQRTEHHDEAVSRLSELRVRHPEHPGANVAWIHSLIQAGRAKEGLSEAVKHLKRHPTDRNGLLACAEAADALGMHEHASKWRQKALA